MMLTNSTAFGNKFLKRLTSWCCKQIGLPIRKVKLAAFTNCRAAYRGRAFHSRRILVRIGPASAYPVPPHRYGGYNFPTIHDRYESLVAITAHGLTHVLQYVNGQAHQRDREYSELIQQWEELDQRSAAKSPIPLLAQRAAKAQARLAKWQRKLKLAQTKVKRYKQQVAYYAKRGY